MVCRNSPHANPTFTSYTQKIFLLLHEKGLAYQAEAEVNYDPVDKTVLANEQVDANGYSWRSGAKVEKKRLKQWFFRISEFREALLRDLEVPAKDNAWPDRVLTMQKHWLGKSEGALLKFPIIAFEHKLSSSIEVFTTRPDTLFGVQYLALAPTHPIVVELAKKDPELQAFLDTLPGLPPDSKVGYLLPHLRAVNPMAYHEETPEPTKEALPVYVASYVLGDYGEGAVMGVPGHDLRDHAFWKEHQYNEPVRVVLAASDDESTTALLNEPFVDHGYMTQHSGPFKGHPSSEAGKNAGVNARGCRAGEAGREVEAERLASQPAAILGNTHPHRPLWLVWKCARARGSTACGAAGGRRALGTEEARKPARVTGQLEEFTTCPKCGGAATRDTDTMDTFVDSSWYYMRFVDPHNPDVPFSPAAETSSRGRLHRRH